MKERNKNILIYHRNFIYSYFQYTYNPLRVIVIARVSSRHTRQRSNLA